MAQRIYYAAQAVEYGRFYSVLTYADIVVRFCRRQPGSLLSK